MKTSLQVLPSRISRHGCVSNASRVVLASRVALATVVLEILVLSSATTCPLLAETPREMRVFDLRFLCQEPWTVGPIPEPPTIRGGGLLGWDRDLLREPLQLPDDYLGTQDYNSPGRSLRLSSEQVAKAIRALIDEDSWANARNRIEGDSGTLVVVQSPAVLERIERLLSRLEARAARRVSLDIVIVPVSALDAVAPGWRRPGSSPWLPAEALDRAVAACAGSAVLFSGPVREGEVARVRPQKLSHHVADVEFNSTGVIPVLNPCVSSVPEGDYAEVLMLASPAGGWFRADLRVGSTSLLGPEVVRRIGIAEVDLLTARDVRLETSVLLPRSRTTVVGVFAPEPSAEGADASPVPPAPGATPKPSSCRAAGFAVLLRAERLETPAQPMAVDAAGPFDLDLGVFVANLPMPRIEADRTLDPFATSLLQDVTERAPVEPFVPPTILDGLIQDAIPSEARGTAKVWRAGGTALIGGGGVKPADLRERLDAEARSRLRLVQVDLWQGAVPAAELRDLGAVGMVLDEAWLARAERAPGIHARLATLSGAGAALASVVARNYVRDIECLSGGTLTEIVEVVDPEIRRVGEGIVLDVRPSLVPETPWVQLELEGELARPPRFERKARSRSGSTFETKPLLKAGEDGNAASDGIELDLPDEDSDRWAHAVTVPLGRPVLLNALPDPANPGRTRILVAVVSTFEVPPPAGK